jgi:photosystem II stability/assembly factor-like uncharacterized protein
MRPISRILLAVFLICATCLSHPATAQARANTWTPIGPYGSDINAMVMASGPGNSLFAATLASGIWKSVDGGLHWASASQGTGGASIYTLLADPANPDTLYAGGYGIVFKTTDGGLTWAQAGQEMDPDNAHKINTLVTASDGTLLAGTEHGGIYRSTDSGTTWGPANNGLPAIDGIEITCMAVDPTNTEIIYAGLNTGALYKSKSTGGSWVEVTFPNPNPPSGTAIRGIAIRAVAKTGSPGKQAPILFVGNLRSIYRSADGGNTWTKASPTFDTINSMAMDSIAGVLYVGDYATIRKVAMGNDDSIWLQNWSAIDLLEAQMSDFILAAGKLAGQMYAGSHYRGGIWFTADAGSSWTERSNGFAGIDITSIAMHPKAPNLIIATAYDGVFISADRGATWQRSTDIGVGTDKALFDPTNPDLIYVVGSNAGFYKSVDRGLTFGLSNTGLDDPSLHAAAIDPQDAQKIYVGTHSKGVYKTIDGGSTWNAANTGLETASILAVAVDPAHADVVYASVESDGLYRSPNAGVTWTRVDLGLPGGQDSYLATIEFAPSDPNYIYLGVQWRIVRSKDSGATWQNYYVGGDNEHTQILIDPQNPEKLYMKDEKEVLTSSNAGKNWSAFDRGPLPDFNVAALIFDPLSTGRMYLGLQSGSIYVYEQPITYLPLVTR